MVGVWDSRSAPYTATGLATRFAPKSNTTSAPGWNNSNSSRALNPEGAGASRYRGSRAQISGGDTGGGPGGVGGGDGGDGGGGDGDVKNGRLHVINGGDVSVPSP